MDIIDQEIEASKQILRRIALERKRGKEALDGKWQRPDPRLEPFLQLHIPVKDRNYKTLVKMLNLFIQNRSKENYNTPNYELYSCIQPTIRNNRYKVVKTSKKTYLDNKVEYDTKIKNRIRTLRKFLKPIGYTVKFRSHFSEIVPLEEVA